MCDDVIRVTDRSFTLRSGCFDKPAATAPEATRCNTHLCQSLSADVDLTSEAVKDDGPLGSHRQSEMPSERKPFWLP